MANKNFKTQTTRTQDKRWTNISGDMTIFANEYDGKIYLSSSISRKNNDDEYTNLYFNVNFPKGEGPSEVGQYKVNVKRGFLSCYADRDGNPKLVAVIQEYDVI